MQTKCTSIAWFLKFSVVFSGYIEERLYKVSGVVARGFRVFKRFSVVSTVVEDVGS